MICYCKLGSELDAEKHSVDNCTTNETIPRAIFQQKFRCWWDWSFHNTRIYKIAISIQVLWAIGLESHSLYILPPLASNSHVLVCTYHSIFILTYKIMPILSHFIFIQSACMQVSSAGIEFLAACAIPRLCNIIYNSCEFLNHVQTWLHICCDHFTVIATLEEKVLTA